MQVIFARHGQTVFNVEDRFQGISDSPITDQGITQAKLLAKFIKPFSVEKVLVSPLPRVLQSYEILSKDKGYSFEVRNDLREICYGKWEMKTKEEIKNSSEWLERQKDKFNFRHPGNFKDNKGESYADLYNRLVEFFSTLKTTKTPTLVLSHLGVMRSALKYFKSLSDIETGELSIPNNAVIVVSGNGASILVEIKHL